MNRRTRLLLLLAVVATFVCPAVAFGLGTPVQPGNATAAGFLPSSGCACHAARVTEWSTSMHAKSIVDTVFLTKVGEAQAEAGDSVAIFCKRCHSPIGNMTGDPNASASQVAKEGVTCMFCHQVTGLIGVPGNVDQLVDASLIRRAQLTNPAAPHPAAYSKLHESAEFCGGCHNVNHPTNGVHLESTYAEWKAGPYAAEGTVCQDCHMSSAPGVIGPSTGTACQGGAQRDNIFAMSFVGANVGQGPAEASTALLKRAATVELDIPGIVAEGTSATVTVTVSNTGAGHYLPTGLTEVRQMWLSVYVEREDGGKTTLGERRFGTVMKDAKGAYPAEMWNAAGVQSDDRIPPRGSISASYSFTMPSTAERAKVVAALLYKSVPDDLAAKANVENPTTEMAVSSRTVFVSAAAKGTASSTAEPIESTGKPGSVLPFVAGAVVLVVIGVIVGLRGRAHKDKTSLT